jgi:uncharacterized cupredoxin-like copper-binding protein
MPKNTQKTSVLIVGLLLMMLGCAEREPPVESVNAQGEKAIYIKADSYKFEPSNIAVNQGDMVVFTIRNISDIDHNFTIKDPEGEILKSVFLRAGKTEHIAISFPKKGTYAFYCALPLHTEMGMKGSIEVGPESNVEIR